MAIPEGGITCHLSNSLDRRTASNAPIEIIAENTAVANKNPGALAGATGEIDAETHEKSLPDYTKKPRRSAMSKWAKKAHKRTARAIGYALTLGTFEAWAGATLILKARLTAQERAALAYAALSSLEDDDAYQVASLVVFGTVRGRAAQ